MKTAIPFLLAGLLLAGCDSRPVSGPVKSVEFYDANPDAREKVLEVCDATPALYATDRNCFNADASRHKPGHIEPTGGKGYSASGD